MKMAAETVSPVSGGRSCLLTPGMHRSTSLLARGHAALEPVACAPTPEAAGAGLAAPRLFRLRRQIRETQGRGGA